MGGVKRAPFLLGGDLDVSAEGVDQPHLLRRSAGDVKELGRGDENREAAGARDRDVQAVA